MSDMELETPTLSDPSNRRSNPRKRVEGHMSLVDLGTDNGGLILDISEGGLSMQAVFPVTPNPAIPVHFVLPNTDVSINATAEIAWGTGSKQAGLRFTDIPGSARDHIREWLNTESSFADAFPETFTDETRVYSDLPPVNPLAMEWLDATADKTIRYVPDFAKQDYLSKKASQFEDLPTVHPGMDLGASDQSHYAQRTVRYVPEFVKKAQPVTPITIPKPVAVKPQAPATQDVRIEELPEVHPLEEAATAIAPPAARPTTLSGKNQWQALTAVVGRPLASHVADSLSGFWPSLSSLEELRSMPAPRRRRMLHELEFQARAVSLWLFEIGVGPAPTEIRVMKPSERQAQPAIAKTPPLSTENCRSAAATSTAPRYSEGAPARAIAQKRSEDSLGGYSFVEPAVPQTTETKRNWAIPAAAAPTHNQERPHRNPALKSSKQQDAGQKRVRINPRDTDKLSPKQN